jgi:phosphoglycerate dehydrogenase-like enzyme
MSHAAAARPVVVNQLGPVIASALAAHPARPLVRDRPIGQAPWEIEDADVLLTGPDRAWQRAPSQPARPVRRRLRWVQVASTGVDWFPRWLIEAPMVTCGRGHNAEAIAEYVLAAILLHEKRLDAVRVRAAEDWTRHSLGTLRGKVLGLAGYGAIGRAIAGRARAFGMTVLALRRSAWSSAETEIIGVDSLGVLASASDHLALAMPLTEATHHCINATLLSVAKPGLHLINVARGGLVDQTALLDALDSDRIAFATLDVTDPEPLPAFHPLFTHPRVRLTPHISWSGEAPGVASGRAALTSQIVANLDAYVRGDALLHVVDPHRGY